MDSPPYKAFVSSTYIDLKDHRAQVIHSLRNAGLFVDPMENWTADSNEPKNFSQDRLNGCHLCVLLVAYRRGHVPDGETRSITQLEYDTAVKQGIDVLPFLLAEDEPWRGTFNELEKDPGIKAWREELRKRHGVQEFSLDPRSIDMTGALGRWLAKKRPDQSGPEMIQRIDWSEGTSPYPGLDRFNEDYAPLFFGRDRDVDAVLEKMRKPQGRFLVVQGPSGSGKSSLVAAGLWQAVIKRGQLLGGKRWIWKRMTPGAGKAGPFVKLAMVLQEVFPQLTEEVDELAALLENDALAVGRCIAAHPADGRELVLVVDQLEELFTQEYSAETIQAFLAALVTLSGDLHSRIRVITTIRSDFFGRLRESESVLQKINDGFQYLVPPLSLTAWPEVIQKPADATGYTFEEGLVDAILNEVGLKEPGNLPLIAYALNRLFVQRQGNTFTHVAYQEMGGVAGAIASTADDVMEKLGDGGSASFDRVFAELVHVERDGPPTRRRVPLVVFQQDAKAMQLIQTLAGPKCRILVKDEADKVPTVEVAHEKLFTAWPRLKTWVRGSQEALGLIEHAREAAHRWHKVGRRLEWLWSGQQAKEALAAVQRFGKTLEPDCEQFLKPQQGLITQLVNKSLSHETRLLIGKKLTEFGDPRPGVGLRSDGLPDIAWVEVPGGRVSLEERNHVFAVKPFRIAKYPVTNEQFEAFLKAEDGYRNKTWWEDIEQSPKAEDPSWQEANCPRETVSWYEAIAFCRWLSAQMGISIRLPTEWEWQQAATGGDLKREYPWEGEWAASRCNSWESRLSRTTAVGMYPQGATEQGVLDMAGNVREWCLNQYDNPEQPEAVHINKGGTRVIRGGAWYDIPGYLRVSSRDGLYPDFRSNYIGVRLAQDIS